MTPNLTDKQKARMRCLHYRGYIIDLFIDIETMIELSISAFYADNTDKKFDLHVLLTHKSSMDTSKKIMMFNYMVKEYYSEFLKENKSLLEDIEELLRLRNIVAHRKQSFRENDIENFNGVNVRFLWTSSTRGKIKEDSLLIDIDFLNGLDARFTRTTESLKKLIEIIEK